jgi:hypothetical protein
MALLAPRHGGLLAPSLLEGRGLSAAQLEEAVMSAPLHDPAVRLKALTLASGFAAREARAGRGGSAGRARAVVAWLQSTWGSQDVFLEA